MKNLSAKSLVLPEVKVLEYGRNSDERGYFTEVFRRSDFNSNPDLSFLKGIEFVQQNESFSNPGTMRGLHFQWSPYMGKLVRTLYGHMVDIVMDIRKGSPNFGKAILYDMPHKSDAESGEWIWIPPGFAHGNFFFEPTAIEYLCTGEYNQSGEAGISPLSSDIDWSLADAALKVAFNKVIASPEFTIKEKDREAPELKVWQSDPRSENFIYGKL